MDVSYVFIALVINIIEKPSQSICLPFLCLTASLGSVTNTLTLTEEYANSNNFKVRPRALTDFA
jgi:hypothetical protein